MKQMMYVGAVLNKKHVLKMVDHVPEGELVLRLTERFGTHIARLIMEHAYYDGGYSYEGKFAVLYVPESNDYIIIAPENKYPTLVEPVKRGFNYKDMDKIRKARFNDGHLLTDEEAQYIQVASIENRTTGQQIVARIYRNVIEKLR